MKKPNHARNDPVVIRVKQASELLAKAKKDLQLVIQRGKISPVYLALVSDKANEVALLALEINQEAWFQKKKV